MFAGWDFSPNLTTTSDWVAKAYASGVPMGGDLPVKAGPTKADDAAPTLAFWAIKDPDGANLDRIQVIKVWLVGKAIKEKVFDVAWSGGRKVDPATGKATQ